jgi:SAM-dependent methyltransferase
MERTAHPGPAVDERNWGETWQRSWDRQQEGYMPDREQRLGALVDLVEAVAGPAPRLLDLACGTGSISRRLLARLPAARVVALDVDPALLAIASATLGGDGRVRIVRADLADPAWARAVDGTVFDAVVTATALHWLPEATLARLYRDLRGLVRPGGVVANADDMAPADLPRLAGALDGLARRRRDEVRADGRPDWSGWWDIVAADPVLAPAVAERRRLFGGDHATSFEPPAEWHVTALASAGFGEAGVAWRSGAGAIVAALR